jgi:hypothetical protein
MYGILTDKQLLLEGKPNKIVAYADMVRAKELADKRIQAFESKYNKVSRPKTIDDTIDLEASN